MKQINILLWGPLILLITSCGSKQSTDNAQVETDISPVIPKINSTVAQILVNDNETVREGDTLILLDEATYKIAVKQAEIALATARQNVKLSKSNKTYIATGVSFASANTSAVSANMTAANAGVEAAKVRLETAEKNLSRFSALLAEKSTTQQQFDLVKAERDAAVQQLRIAEGQVLALQKQIAASQTQVTVSRAGASTSDNNVALAELNVKQAETNLEAAKLQLSYCVITAPSAGIVSKKNVQKGQVVAIGQPLMAIVDDKKIWVVANFKETQLENMKKGQVVEIEVDAYDDKTFKGLVGSFSQATGAKFSLLPPDNATGNFVKVTQRVPVKILFDEPLSDNFPLRAGMSVSVTVKTN